MLKDTYLTYIRPEDGVISDVMLMDKEFKVESGMSATGAKHGVLISNLNRWVIVQLLPAVGSVLPVTQGLQPITTDILGGKPIEWPPCVPHKLKDSSEVKGRLILKKGLTNE